MVYLIIYLFVWPWVCNQGSNPSVLDVRFEGFMIMSLHSFVVEDVDEMLMCSLCVVSQYFCITHLIRPACRHLFMFTGHFKITRSMISFCDRQTYNCTFRSFTDSYFTNRTREKFHGSCSGISLRCSVLSLIKENLRCS